MLRVELLFEDQQTDLVGGGFDLAFRIGHPHDSAFVGRRLGDVAVLVCAAPAYLEEHGTPQHPRELSGHCTVIYSSPRVSLSTWHYLEGDRDAAISIRPRLSVNTGEALLAAVLDGAGVGLLPWFMAAAHVKAGRLVELFADVSWPPYAPLVAVYPARAQLPPKTRAFMDAVIAEVRKRPIERRTQNSRKEDKCLPL